MPSTDKSDNNSPCSGNDGENERDEIVSGDTELHGSNKENHKNSDYRVGFKSASKRPMNACSFLSC